MLSECKWYYIKSEIPRLLKHTLQQCIFTDSKQGLLSNPLMLHCHPEESCALTAFLQIYGQMLSSNFTSELIRNRKSKDNLVKFIVEDLLLNPKDEQKNPAVFEQYSIGMHLMQEMFTSLDNIIAVESVYAMTSKILCHLNRVGRDSNKGSSSITAATEGVATSTKSPSSPNRIGTAGASIIIDEHSFRHFYALQTLNCIGGISERWYGFRPKSRDLSSPWRIPRAIFDGIACYKPPCLKEPEAQKLCSNDCNVVMNPTSTAKKSLLSILQEGWKSSGKIREFFTSRHRSFCRPSKEWKSWGRPGSPYSEVAKMSDGMMVDSDDDAKMKVEAHDGNRRLGNRQMVIQLVNKLEGILKATSEDISTFRITRNPRVFTDKKFREKCEASRFRHVKFEPEAGISLMVDYGVKTGLILPKENVRLKHVNCMSKFLHHFVPAIGNLDWFAALVYLMHCHLDENLSGSVEAQQGWGGNALRTLELLKACPCSVFLWPEYGAMYSAVINGNKSDQQRRCVDSFLLQLAHFVYIIGEKETPQAFAALSISGVSLINVVTTWTRHCFINHLDISEIMAYILFPLRFGADYQVYFIVALLKHLEEDIKRSSWKFAIDELLLQNPIVGFDPVNEFASMKELEKTYRSFVIGEMHKFAEE